MIVLILSFHIVLIFDVKAADFTSECTSINGVMFKYNCFKVYPYKSTFNTALEQCTELKSGHGAHFQYPVGDSLELRPLLGYTGDYMYIGLIRPQFLPQLSGWYWLGERDIMYGPIPARSMQTSITIYEGVAGNNVGHLLTTALCSIYGVCISDVYQSYPWTASFTMRALCQYEPAITFASYRLIGSNLRINHEHSQDMSTNSKSDLYCRSHCTRIQVCLAFSTNGGNRCFLHYGHPQEFPELIVKSTGFKLYGKNE